LTSFLLWSVDDSNFTENKARLVPLLFKAATQNSIIFNLLLKNNEWHRRRIYQEKKCSTICISIV